MSALANVLNRFVIKIGDYCAWANVLLIFVIILQVVLRYGFSDGMIALEEMQWHLYAVVIMIGFSYALAKDNHVRVDLVSSKFSMRTKLYIEIFGMIFLFFPFLFIMIYHGINYVESSFLSSEVSPSPGGLPLRWLIKSLIPISMLLMFMATLSHILKSITLLGEFNNGSK